MKKLLFTAMAVVAFSGVAMANTVKVKNEVANIAQFQKCEDATPCEDAAINYYEAVIKDGPDNLDFLNYLLSLCQ